LIIENLLPENVDRLRRLYQDHYARRPILLIALERVLADLDRIWAEHEQGLPPDVFERLNQQLLPALLSLTSMPLTEPSSEEIAVEAALRDWNMLALMLHFRHT
jgi:hypothetical protein